MWTHVWPEPGLEEPHRWPFIPLGLWDWQEPVSLVLCTRVDVGTALWPPLRLRLLAPQEAGWKGHPPGSNLCGTACSRIPQRQRQPSSGQWALGCLLEGHEQGGHQGARPFPPAAG